MRQPIVSPISRGIVSALSNQVLSQGIATNALAGQTMEVFSGASVGGATAENTSGVGAFSFAISDTLNIGDRLIVDFDLVVNSGSPAFDFRNATQASPFSGSITSNRYFLTSSGSYSLVFEIDATGTTIFTCNDGDLNNVVMSNLKITLLK